MEVKTIHYIDCRDIHERKVDSRFKEIVQMISSLEGHLLILFDFEGTFLSSTIRTKFNEIFTTFSDQIKSAAITGVGQGVRKLIIQSLNYPLYISDDKSDCEEWLLDQ